MSKVGVGSLVGLNPQPVRWGATPGTECQSWAELKVTQLVSENCLVMWEKNPPHNGIGDMDFPEYYTSIIY